MVSKYFRIYLTEQVGLCVIFLQKQNDAHLYSLTFKYRLVFHLFWTLNTFILIIIHNQWPSMHNWKRCFFFRELEFCRVGNSIFGLFFRRLIFHKFQTFRHFFSEFWLRKGGNQVPTFYSNHACIHDDKNDESEPDQRTHQPQAWPFDAATPKAETQLYLDLYDVYCIIYNMHLYICEKVRWFRKRIIKCTKSITIMFFSIYLCFL